MNNTIILNRLNDLEISEMRDANPTRRTRRTRRMPLLRQLVLLAVLLAAGTLTAAAQSVIMSGNYYLTHNAAGTTVNTAATTTFNPATCLWYVNNRRIRTADINGDYIDGNTYLQYTSLTLGTSVQWNRAQNNGYSVRGTNNNYYLRLNGTTWQTSNTNSNNGYLYAVTINTTDATITAPTISGADVLTATGTSNYSASGAAYRGSYTNYRFNNADHYVDADGDNLTGAPTNATLGAATWSLSDNAYATVIATNGTVTVNSLPENDVELTLTVSYPVTAGTGRPEAPAGITLTATKTITIQGTNPSAPVITVNGTSVTLATAAVGSTTIRYTLDGSDPSTSTGTVYSGAIDLSGSTTSPITIKAITVRDGHASSVTEREVTLTLPVPTVTADGSALTATISSSVDGATIYYTTDGTTPTTASTQYTGTISGLALMTTVKAIAVKSGWNDSPEASATVTLPSGTDGTTVTLFDLEDHNWSYYKAAGDLPTGYPDPIHSPDPRNVTITYKGNGQTIGTTTVSGVKVSIAANETENTFVYYKTLEKGTDGKYAYTTITNPFSVRPKIGTTYYGFDGWEVVSVAGGTIDGYAAGSTIPANTEIKFVPTRTYTTNSMSMEVVLRAKWAVAEVSTNGNFTNNYGVERMFYVLNSNSTNTAFTANNKAITYTSIYPNGTYDETNAASTSNIKYRPFGASNAFTLSADGRIENVQIYNGNDLTMNANNHNLTVGRNVSGYNGGNTAATVKGHAGGGANNYNPFATAMNYTICLESGTYGKFYLIDDYDRSTKYYSGRISIKGVFGSDYDRAKHDDSRLHVAPDGSISAAEWVAMTGSANKDQLAFDWNVKSGKLQENLLGNASAEKSLYMAPGSSAQYVGKRRLLVEGGELASIAGGIESYANLTANGYTVADTYVSDDLTDQVYIRITNNDYTKVRGSIYGAAAFAGSRGGRTFIITGGTINGWIAGGCNGTQSSGGQLYGTTYMYIGGNAQVVHAEADPYIGAYDPDYGTNGAYGGNIFGAGCGIMPNGYDAANPGATLATATVGKVYGSNIALADNLVVSRFVYGGGNFGQVADNSGNWSSNNDMTSNIYVLGGDVKGNVFGGSNNQQGQTVNVMMTGGLVEGGIYGGSNTWGTINNDVTIQINGGQVGTTTQTANVHGGGYGQATRVNGDVSVTLGVCDATSGATIYGDVYGGSAMGTVNDQGTDKTTVSLYKGTIYGGLYGGGYGPGGEDADVEGAVQVNVFGGSVLCSASDPDGEAGTGSVFGCNNVSGTPRNSVKVDIYNTDQVASGYALHAVYGGGNKAPYEGTPVVTIHGCNNKIEYVYGGGNATDVEGTSVTIWGGTIGNAFGGGNGYSITKNHNNASAPHYNPGANITTYGTHLNIYGGSVLAAFGGSNQYGTITGGVEVNVEPREESNTGRPDCVAAYTQCAMNIGELYGGGNEAALVSSHNPDNYIDQNDINVNISCEAVVGMLFGGAKAADYVGDINLVVDGGHFEKVFGGNNKGGTITGNVSVTFNGGSAGEVYGGCNEKGTITGGITVDIDSTNTTCTPRFYVENVYGGGNLAAYTGSPLVNIKNGTVQQNVYGGGFGSTAIVTGTPVVTVGVSDAGKTARVWGHVFGGGNAAAITGNTSVNILYNSLVKGHVFGGGNAAAVSTDTFVLVRDKAKVLGNIYGGGNQGKVGGNTKVVVNGD